MFPFHFFRSWGCAFDGKDLLCQNQLWSGQSCVADLGRDAGFHSLLCGEAGRSVCCVPSGWSGVIRIDTPQSDRGCIFLEPEGC